MKKLSKEQRFRRRVEMLKANYPPALPVTVALRKTDFCDIDKTLRFAGYCTCNGKRFFITVNPEGPWVEIFDTLLHEWAHILTWDSAEKYNNNPHNQEWGIAYAMIYTAMIEHDPISELEIFRRRTGNA